MADVGREHGHETAALCDHGVCDSHFSRELHLAHESSAQRGDGSNGCSCHNEWLCPTSNLPRLQRLVTSHIPQLDGRGGKDSDWLESDG